MSKVYFVGAGPGDPELITIKGKKLLDSAEVIIYTGSLVNPELLNELDAEIYDSSKMNLDEIINVIERSMNEGKTVVRLHTGDTSLYSAISEQIERLRKINVEYEVIPGVSSAMAGAAILGQELTIPEIGQTVIITRIAGRTPVPNNEKISEMAKHRTTMILFLSIGLIEDVVEQLKVGYPDDTPVVVIYKATWQDQKIIRGTLKNIAELVKENDIGKTALIYVGEVLKASEGYTGKHSKLYNKDFKHGYRS